MIVKNEENCLARTLESIQSLVDEIVITDTGSTDATIEIASRFTDRILIHPWQDSFSEARNYSLQYSTTDWVCSIDADEWIECDESELETLLNSELNTVYCPILSELPGGRVGRHFLPRLFKRGTAHYEGVVHNQLIHSQPAGATNAIRFSHTGYNESPEIMKRKQERTINLLRKQLESDPANTYALMNLGRVLRNHGELQEAMDVIERGLALEKSNLAIREMLLITKLLSLVDLEDAEGAQKVAIEGLAVNAANLDFLFMKAKLAFNAGDWVNTIIGFRAYQREREAQEQGGVSLVVYDFWEAGVTVNQMLATAFQELGQTYAARQEWRTAIALDGYNRGSWAGYIECCDMLGMTQESQTAQSEALARGIRL